MVYQWFGFKITGTVFSDLASKLMVTISLVCPQNWQLRFGDLCLKITATVSSFGSQNQAGFGLSVAPQNRWEDAMAWDTR
jgi:hypothetical protein